MTDITSQALDELRDEAETTTDRPLSPSAARPGGQRAKVLSVRLNPDEFDELARYAAALDVPASTLVRGWVLDQLRTSDEPMQQTVERLARDIQQLRHQIVA
jgi:hypothetical protein